MIGIKIYDSNKNNYLLFVMNGMLKFFFIKIYTKIHKIHLNLMSHIIILNNIKLDESICLVLHVEILKH